MLLSFYIGHGTAKTAQSIFHAPRMPCTTNKCWEILLNLAMKEGLVGCGGVMAKLELHFL